MTGLEGKVALVTGGTRNVGKGIAKALRAAGVTVYVTGRTIGDRDVRDMDKTKGQGIALVCDHRVDDSVRDVFQTILDKEGRLDLLVNNAWGGYRRLRERSANPGFKWREDFWKQPADLFDDMFDVGVRSNYMASWHAARIMVPQGHGLIVNISFFSGKTYMGNVCYGVAKNAVDRMTADMAKEFRKHGVACVSLYPGVIDDRKKTPNPKKETSQFTGRAIAALLGDPDVMKKSGHVLVSAVLQHEYGFTDIDGTRPEPYMDI
jgi:dehydrogenase/reductase SDR family member 1